MKENSWFKILGPLSQKPLKWFLIMVLILFFGAMIHTNAQGINLNVIGVNKDGSETPVTEYRWLVEKDFTYHVIPGDPTTNWAVDFHRSYMPVAAKGDTLGTPPDIPPTPPDVLILESNTYYFVSVLPKQPGTYTIGGAPFLTDEAGNASVDVYLNQLPLPAAQIAIFVFQDNFPINNAPDLPEEQGLEGFSIILEDAGGRYGMSAGTQMLDAFGHPLGTVYQKDKQTGEFLLDADGMPIPELKKGIPLVEHLETGPDGTLTIKNLAPGKYGVMAVPPPGTNWVQTSTIEGKKVIDAWVKANEPPFFAEFGPPGYHVAIGFVNPMNTISQATGGRTIRGKIVNLHLSRPPETAFYNGAPFTHTTPWVGLNLGATGQGGGVYAAGTVDGYFAIPNVPAGDYQLVVWDSNLDLIFAFKGVSVAAGDGELNLGEVPVFQWFSRLENWVFNDIDGDGFWDPAEMGIPEQAINLRWRDGTMYQSMPTDSEGFVPFDEVFPFFSWLVAEVDFVRFKATGVTVVVDDGGPVPFVSPWSFGGQLNPQPQPDPDNPGLTLSYRVETGPVLTEAFQGFLGQTSVLLWGKRNYVPGENGGISGIVYYSTTRAEDDPTLGAAEPWEPGIPDVRVNLYDSTGEILINTTTTDNWDASLPEDCPPGGNDPDGLDPFYQDGKCYDGMRNWNQVRPGIFDGGYAFTDYYPSGILTDLNGNPLLDAEGNPIPAVAGEPPILLQSGTAYVVEVIPPPGYEIVRTQDRNVDFGDTYIPSRLRAAGAEDFAPYPICVGDPYPVPAELSLFPDVTHPYYDPESPWYKGPEFDPFTNPFFLNDCDRKLVYLSDMENAAADFFLFTEVPIAGHIVGFILDDTANEFDPRSPQFGEKYAPPWLPVSIRDWTGREIARTYSDQFGRYNALVPSTYTTNLPAPSGMSPNMLTVCMNDPILPDGSKDPQFNPQYSTFCYTFQYMPGATTYLDTPVIPVAAFAGPGQFPLDCEFPDGTPRIRQVDGGPDGGPYVPADGTKTINIQSMGMTEVPNPGFCPSTDPYCVENDMVDDNPTILRDYGFGSFSPGQSRVTIGATPLQINSWDPDQITATVPAGVTTGQLTVTRGDNSRSTIVGVTVTVGQDKENFNVVRVNAPSSPGVFPGAIQQAIDSALDGDLILVAPGDYREMVIMWKPIKLQGYGAGSTTISAFKTPAEKLVYWRQHVQMLIGAGLVDLLPAQELAFGGIEPATLFTEEGAGILVIAKNSKFKEKGMARIDGFTITGADTGGGIVVNGYADFLKISNNRIENNSGFFGGGIRIGHPQLTDEGPPIVYADADNDFLRITHNHIKQNGGLGAVGGGISLCTGSDSYEVSDNWICGNFTLGEGGGIGHTGLSDRDKKDDPLPVIKNNTIIFNECFNQGSTVSGGGIFIGGGAPLTPGGLSAGSGSVQVIGNLIQGNSSGAGDGAGIRLSRINGQDVENNPTEEWYCVDIFNNMIVNNVAALAAGGISLQDIVRGHIINNTVANNDSTATAGEAFAPGSPSESTPQPAGIVSHAHSPELAAVLPVGEKGFPDPQLEDNIILHNRSFYFFGDPLADPPIPYGLRPDVEGGEPPVYDDLAVLGTAGFLNPQYCILTNKGEDTGHTYDVTNIDEFTDGADPAFIQAYFNGNRGTNIIQLEATTIQAPAAFDEGGNFIRLRYGPLALCDDASPGDGDPGICSDYHIQTGPDPALDAVDAGTDLIGTFPELSSDFDGESRPSGAGVDIGADEYYIEPVILGLQAATTGLHNSNLQGEDLIQTRSSTITQGTSTSLLSWPESYPLGSSLPGFSLTSNLSGQTLFSKRSVYTTGLSHFDSIGFNQGAIGLSRLSLTSDISGQRLFPERSVYTIGSGQLDFPGFYPSLFDWQKLSLSPGFSRITLFPGRSIYPAGLDDYTLPTTFSRLISSERIYPGLQNLYGLREFF